MVLDGHGERGDLVSNELLVSMHERIGSKRWAAADRTTLEAQLVEAFEGAHAQLDGFALNEKGVTAARESGAAAVALLICEGHLMMAHSGDCRAVLGTLTKRGMAPSRASSRSSPTVDLETIELTRDHKLDDDKESRRILSTGAWSESPARDPNLIGMRRKPCVQNTRY